ncbi:UbiA prenyltransferase family protein [Actinoallomurus sp. NPDC050550]|uniref:UbiA prenyltransferase family protein n=1 Tax=Actinoallomurus sp. NPDC050550 TaxID=3154937 RepID=UPI0033CF602F
MHTVDPAGSGPTVREGRRASPAPDPTPHSLVRDLIAISRPRQWAKTLLVVPLPLVCARSWSASEVVRVCLAVAVFTLVSCVTYVVNDIADRERDKKHPVKRMRPIAAGRFPVYGAWLYAAVLAGLLCVALIGWRQIGWWPVLVYLGMNAVYSRGLKHVPLVDVFLIAVGFLLRLIQGYLAIGQPVSGWLLLCVLCLCLMLSLGKRRHELVTVGSGHRPSLQGYSVALVDQLILLNAALTLMAYVLYLVSGARFDTQAQAIAFLSIPVGLFAVSRYLQLVIVRQGGGEPVETLLRDRVLIADFALWTLLLGTATIDTHYPGLTHALFVSRP